MIEQGDLAERISNRSSDLKDWLMTLDILRVLEGVVELMKTVSDQLLFRKGVMDKYQGQFYFFYCTCTI